jgi:glucokinase
LTRAFEATAVGIDVGGTKIAAGIVELATGRVVERRQVPTEPGRGGAAVLDDCAALASELGAGDLPVGIGLCELVGLDGRPSSADTIDWRHLDVAAAIEAPTVVVESDVRAAARAEARFGAGKGRSPFLYVVVGSGASMCLVVDGEPYRGARGQAVVLGAPPVEVVASGLALQRLSGLDRAQDVLASAEHDELVASAAALLGQTVAVVANALDPEVIVLGGGLGGDDGFRARVAREVTARIAYPAEPPLEITGSLLAADGGIVGAALSAAAASAR